jgi:3-phosphoglycerate kinase
MEKFEGDIKKDSGNEASTKSPERFLDESKSSLEEDIKYYKERLANPDLAKIVKKIYEDQLSLLENIEIEETKPEIIEEVKEEIAKKSPNWGKIKNILKIGGVGVAGLSGLIAASSFFNDGKS